MPDNFALKIEGAGLNFNELERVIDTLASKELWKDSEVRRALLAKVPEYRLSKFQNLLPDHLQVEMIGGYLLDFDGTADFLSDSLRRAYLPLDRCQCDAGSRASPAHLPLQSILPISDEVRNCTTHQD